MIPQFLFFKRRTGGGDGNTCETAIDLGSANYVAVSFSAGWYAWHYPATGLTLTASFSTGDGVNFRLYETCGGALIYEGQSISIPAPSPMVFRIQLLGDSTNVTLLAY